MESMESLTNLLQVSGASQKPFTALRTVLFIERLYEVSNPAGLTDVYYSTHTNTCCDYKHLKLIDDKKLDFQAAVEK